MMLTCPQKPKEVDCKFPKKGIYNIETDLKGYQVAKTLEEIWLFRGFKPQKIQVDNGLEFISKELDRWVYE